uniref:Uncharacterized protein n=1 Tax=Anguilla anguilla TaxID=7936 RepID=A0A0E9VD62_ANGAN
MVDLINAA